MPPYSYREAIRKAENTLQAYDKEKRIAQLLAEDLFRMTTAQIMMKSDEPMSQKERGLYEEAVGRVAVGEPYQYVVGFSWFYGEKFKVTTDTLIPRNETEELVMFVVDEEKDDGRIVVDIGTGTGAIPVTLQKHWNQNKVFATDISEGALEVAKENSAAHNTDITFYHGDLYRPLIGNHIKADVIISNPPYISKDDISIMTPSVIEHEPHQALFAEDDGLEIYKRLIDGLPEVLNAGGRVYCEIAFNQKEPLLKYLLKRWPETERFGVAKDINKQDRILYFTWEG
ncbi:MAG TPA: peptide chain release factor N(5)-glutamine methyltransferase [Candidatus Salinicoccus merdavium]|nr:peptide chain release factor N(5)-glutamine methyltransferase [Candidatus Salinicoccus merdavium]